MQGKSNAELLRILIGCGAAYFQGEGISEMLDNLSQVPQEQYSGQSCYPAMRKRLEALLEIVKRSKKELPNLMEGPSMNQSLRIAEHFYTELQDTKQEHFYAVILDSKYRIIEKRLITVGTLTRCLIHPRELFAPAIELRAAAIVMVHNHPSGEPNPSSQDIEVTRRMCEVGELVGISVLDHIIIGKGKYYSFVDEGAMP